MGLILFQNFLLNCHLNSRDDLSQDYHHLLQPLPPTTNHYHYSNHYHLLQPLPPTPTTTRPTGLSLTCFHKRQQTEDQ
ncbi:hypothetical protein EMCRGX_G020759 [Ephydatia muelleri]